MKISNKRLHLSKALTNLSNVGKGSQAEINATRVKYSALAKNRPYDTNEKYLMANYMPVLVWTLSAVLCAYIAKKRGVKATVLGSVFVALFGPFAIPLTLMVKPENQR